METAYTAVGGDGGGRARQHTGGRDAPATGGRGARLSIEEKNRAPGSYKLTSSRLREWRIFKAFTSAERVMFATLTNDEIYTRLVAQWGSLGVIAALVGSIAFAEISNPPSNISSGFWASAFGLCSGLAAVVSLCSAVVCVLFFMALNAGPQDGARFFIDYFLLLLPLPILLLVVGQHTSNGGNDNLQ